jgi:methyl-accepting chemotaxis protein
MFGYYDDTIKESVENVLCGHMAELTKTFSASARRWEMIVYHSLFAFILLAAYGFFLIYSLTTDIHRVANDMNSIDNNMQQIVTQVGSISKNMIVMTQTMDVQTDAMREMNAHVRDIAISVNLMSHEVAVMNNSVSRPMQFMNKFMPW